MHPRRTARPIIAWIATLAVLLAALAPALSHALATAAPAHAWIEVCTAEGSRWLPGGGERSPKAGHLLEHCPYCSLQTDMPAVPVATGASWTPAQSAASVATGVAATPRPTQVWAQARPRAPPRRA